MKKKLKLIFISSVLLFIMVYCKPIDEGLELTFNTDIANGKALVLIRDAYNLSLVPKNLKVNILGDNAKYIYDNGGKKGFTIGDNGLLELILDSSQMPTVDNPIGFIVEITGDNIIPQRKEVFINSTKQVAKVNFNLINLTTLPQTLKFTQKTFNLNGGKIVSSYSPIKTNSINNASADSVYLDDGVTSVVLPAGTKFNRIIHHIVYGYKYTYHEAEPGIRQTYKSKDIDSVQTINGTTTEFNSYHDHFYDVPGRAAFKDSTWQVKSDSVEIIPSTSKTVTVKLITQKNQASEESFKFYTEANNSPVMLDILKGGADHPQNLLFSNASLNRVVGLYFVDDEGKEIVPDVTAKWHTNLILNSDFISPITGSKIHEGDLIETGFNYDNYTTFREKVKKSPTGVLFVSTQGFDAGYFRKAAFVTPLTTYNLNTDIGSDIIPDPENLSAFVRIKTDFVTFDVGVVPNQGNVPFSCYIVSDRIANANTGIYVEYGDNVLKTNYKGQDIFAPPYLKELGELITFDITADCPSKKRQGKLTVYQGSNIPPHGYVRFNVSNGKWATRIFKVGENIQLDTNFGNDRLYGSARILSNNVKLTVTSNSNSFCNSF